MSGILDKKTRILDTIVTLDGRRQIAEGKLRIEYASFTDTHAFYEADIVSGSTDGFDRLYFEACSLPQDQITFESDDSGFMLAFKGGKVNSLGGKVLSGSTSTKSVTAVSSSIQFASSAKALLSSSIDNFDKQNVLGSIDPFLEHNKFEIDKENIRFIITSEKPFDLGEMTKTSIDNVESLFQDKRLSHVPNFLYLPPVNTATSEGAEKELLGDYPRLGQPPTFDLSSLMKDLKGRSKRTVRFHKTSQSNNVVGQFFELGPSEFKKLDVIDFGEFRDETDPSYPEKHVFFVGKVFPDVKGMFTFVNIFTLIFE